MKMKNIFNFFIYHIVKKNEAKSKQFIKKFHEFTNPNFRIVISWKTRKISSLFSLIDKNWYPSCKSYCGKCKQCVEHHVGETKRNCIKFWRKTDNPTHKSDPARHINNHVEHESEWSILCNAPIKKHLRKNLEGFLIGVLKPSLNVQTNFERLLLFVNGIA